MFQVRTHETRTLSWWHTNKDDIDFNPPYQRKGGLWTPGDKAYLVDSILNGYDIPKYVGLKLDIHIRKNLSLSLDDNEQVVNMFNKFGIPTCKVEDNFRHAFERVLQLRNDYKDKDNTKVISKSKDNRRSR